MERFSIKVTTQEREALQAIAAQEMRDFRDQARLIIRNELERRGLLKPEKDLSARTQSEVRNG